MKAVLIVFTFCAIYFHYLSSRAHAIFEDRKQYEKMTFDLLLRGSWMLDNCAADLFNCYEIVKGDLMCSNKKYYSSVCAVQRDYCHNQYGMRDDNKNHWYQLYEEECAAHSYEYITRRRAHSVAHRAHRAGVTLRLL